MTWKYLIAAIAVAILALWTADLLGFLTANLVGRTLKTALGYQT